MVEFSFKYNFADRKILQAYTHLAYTQGCSSLYPLGQLPVYTFPSHIQFSSLTQSWENKIKGVKYLLF